MIQMERTQAMKIANALDRVESFEVAMDIFEQAIIRAEEVCDLDGFDDKFRSLMTEEFNRRYKVLEDM